jgi:hypothetical protein
VKRLFLVLLIISVLATLFFLPGCGSSEEGTTKPGEEVDEVDEVEVEQPQEEEGVTLEQFERLKGDFEELQGSFNQLLERICSCYDLSVEAQASIKRVKPGEEVEFLVEVTLTGGIPSEVMIKVNFPEQIIFLGDLQVDGDSYSGDIIAGLNLGIICPGDTKVINFVALAAPVSQYDYECGTTLSLDVEFEVWSDYCEELEYGSVTINVFQPCPPPPSPPPPSPPTPCPTCPDDGGPGPPPP